MIKYFAIGPSQINLDCIDSEYEELISIESFTEEGIHVSIDPEDEYHGYSETEFKEKDERSKKIIQTLLEDSKLQYEILSIIEDRISNEMYNLPCDLNKLNYVHPFSLIYKKEKIFLLFEANLKENLNLKEEVILLNELKAQCFDGWGEGFSQESLAEINILNKSYSLNFLPLQVQNPLYVEKIDMTDIVLHDLERPESWQLGVNARDKKLNRIIKRLDPLSNSHSAMFFNKDEGLCVMLYDDACIKVSGPGNSFTINLNYYRDADIVDDTLIIKAFGSEVRIPLKR